jgi:hypothetical protein
MVKIGNWNFNGVVRSSKPVPSVYSACSFAFRVTFLSPSLTFSQCASTVENVWKLMGNK